MLARACAAKGLEPQAHELIAAAANALLPPMLEPPKSLIDALAQEFSTGLMWNAFIDFSEPSVGRRELLDQFRNIAKHFPSTEHGPRAKATAELLEQMIKEDESHKRPGVSQFAKLPVKERVAELIFQLRDQNGQQWGEPGSVEVFSDPLGERPHINCALGFDAVPQLIEAVDDRRFTRSVWCQRSFGFSHQALRVGDCATAILERLAGCRFCDFLFVEGREELVRKRARDWWTANRAEGREAIPYGSGDAGHLGGERAGRTFNREVPRLCPRSSHCRREEQCRRLSAQNYVLRVADLPGEASTKFLLNEIANSPVPESRVSAAWGFMKRGRAEPVPAMSRPSGKPRRKAHG